MGPIPESIGDRRADDGNIRARCHKSLDFSFSDCPSAYNNAPSVFHLEENRIVAHVSNLGLQVYVQSALFSVMVFPPPAAGTEILPWFHRPRAGSAADARIALFMKPIVGDAVATDVVPHVVVTPIYQWIDFDDVAVLLVHFDPPDIRPRHRLLAPKSCHPSVQTF